MRRNKNNRLSEEEQISKLWEKIWEKETAGYLKSNAKSTRFYVSKTNVKEIKKYKQEHPELITEYIKVSEMKPTIRIMVKEN